MKPKQTKSFSGLFLKLTIIIVMSALQLATLWGQPQQNVTVTGRVTDEKDNLPLPGVIATVKGTYTATQTDTDGRFTINCPVGSTLLVSYIGYKPNEVIITGQATLDIRMQEATEMLDEVVVIGYGSTTKKEVTGSISSLKTSDFNKGSYTDPVGLLQGKVAGLSIAKPDGADPLASYEIILRGTNTLTSGQGPLVIIDGVAGGDLKNINFEEVESIDILKDGSAAAIYGTRGTNGVIIITTKRAKAGKNTVEYSSQVSAQVNPRWIKNLNAKEFEYALQNYAPGKAAGNLYGSSTDWFKEITRDMPLSNRHNLAFSGGNDKFSHRTVIAIDQNEGLLKNNYSDRVLIKTNIKQLTLNDKLELDGNLSYSSRNYSPANYDLFYQAFIQNPTEPVYNQSNTAYGGYSNISALDYYNPVAMLRERVKKGKTDEVGANIRATLFVTKDIKWVNFISSEQEMNEETSYKKRYYPTIIGKKGEAEIDNGRYGKLQYESTFNYSKTIADQNLQLLAGYSYMESNSNSSYMINTGFDSDDYMTNNIAAGIALGEGTAEMGSYREESKLISFFGRLMYNYKQKYMASLSLRREGSSKFGENHKWGWFPAVSLGWRVDEEPFMDNLPWVNSLKLRLGYGVTGNQDFDPYQSLIRTGIAGKFFYNGEWINSYKPVSNPNPDLRWEKKQELNLGADFSLLKDRVFGTLDLYYRSSTDLLYSYSVSVPPYLTNTLFANLGSISNQGVELTITGVAVKKSDFEWSTTLTASSNKNKLKKFTNDEFASTSRDMGWVGGAICVFTQKIKEGQSLGTFYGPVWLGVDEYGYDKFKNQNPVGQVSVDDWEKIGNAYPVVMLGWSNSFRYKNWDMSFTLRSEIGGKVLNTYRLYYENWTTIGTMNIVHTQYEHPNFIGDATYSSKYLENRTFLKMDNISVGYNVPVKSKYVSGMRLNATAQDVFCITGYKGLNPEVSLSGLEPGIENLSYYPWCTTITLGLNVTF